MRRLLPLGAAAALAACIDISSPSDAIESLTAVRTPWPAVVAGDTLRDSLGIARRLEVIAFTGRGDTVHAPEGLRFFLPDTGTGARIEDGYLIAGARTGQLRVVAQVPGLQTPPLTIEVVPAPTIASSGVTGELAVTRYGVTDATVTSPPLTVRVQGGPPDARTDVNGWIVRYTITRQPASNGQVVPADLIGDDNRPQRGDPAAAVDTTAGGTASRRVRLIPSALAQQGPDTVVVEATVTYRGLPLPGSPVVFRVPFAPRP